MPNGPNNINEDLQEVAVSLKNTSIQVLGYVWNAIPRGLPAIQMGPSITIGVQRGSRWKALVRTGMRIPVQR